MSAFNIFFVASLIAVGLFLQGWFAPYAGIAGTIAAFVCAILLIVDRS